MLSHIILAIVCCLPFIASSPLPLLSPLSSDTPEPELSFSPSDNLQNKFHLWIELSRPFTAKDKLLTETLDNQVWTLAELLATAGLYTRTIVVTSRSRYKEKSKLVEFVIVFGGFKNTNSLRLFAAKMPPHRKIPGQMMAELVRLQLITSPEGQLLAPHIRKIGFTSRYEVYSLILEIKSRMKKKGADVFPSKFMFTTIEADKVNPAPSDTHASSTDVAARKSWEELFPRKWTREPVCSPESIISTHSIGENFIFTVSSVDLSNVAGLA